MILGECRCLHVNWGAYNALLAEALRAIEKLVPAVALDRGTPMGDCGASADLWCAQRLRRLNDAPKARPWTTRAGRPCG